MAEVHNLKDVIVPILIILLLLIDYCISGTLDYQAQMALWEVG